MYRKAGKIWISYGVPFIVPITAGLLSALVIGDLLYILMLIII
ncbi:MAG: A24 family peptidase C-terminal domain-containing protein [Methanoregulaceae archaeon]